MARGPNLYSAALPQCSWTTSVTVFVTNVYPRRIAEPFVLQPRGESRRGRVI